MGHTIGAKASLPLIAIALFCAPTEASADEIDDELTEYRRVMLAEVRARTPAAADAIERGDALDEAGDASGALEQYQAAAAQAPSSPHAHRRVCGALLQLSRRTQAIAECEKARSLQDIGVNRGALARALASNPASASDLQKAKAWAYELLSSRELNDVVSACEIYVAANDLEGLQLCVAQLEVRAPNAKATHVFAALRWLVADDLDKAREHVERARELGAPAEMLDGLDKEIDARTPVYTRYWPWIRSFMAVWLTLGLLVVGAGLTLSAITRSVAHHLPPTRTGRAHGATAAVRWAYRGVLWLACLLFYLTLPVMLASVVGFAAGLVYVALAVGRVPIHFMVVILGVCLMTVVATLKSLFVQVADEDPGERLDVTEHPRLAAVLQEVAAKVDTRPVDTVFMTHGTDLAVFERGGIGRRLRGASAERCLILGAGVLKDMKELELKAVLAHEYGHFQNDDTAGGSFALAVRRSMIKLIVGLARGGAATWYNPAWWLARGFYALFLRVSHGASRLQEILADRWAAFSYGSEAFEAGLTHAVRRSVMFGAVADAAIQEAIDAQRPIRNLYRARPKGAFKWADLESEVEGALTRNGSPYDSHPPPQERFALVRKLDAATPADVDREANAWDLFEDRKSIERRFTRKLLTSIEQQLGVSSLTGGGDE